MNALRLVVGLLAMLCSGSALWAASERVALVIGNGSYQHTAALANPRNDAQDVAAALREVGFIVEPPLLDASKSQIESALAVFAGKAQGARQALVYYAGHGVEANGQNYLVPVEAQLLSERTVGLESVELSDVMDVVSGASELGMVVLDACRNNPMASRMTRINPTRTTTRGLAPVEPGGNLLVAYAAEAGSLASDGAGEHSPFAAAFVRALRSEAMEVRVFWGHVRDAVQAATAGEQRPFTYGTLGGRSIFLGLAAPEANHNAAVPGISPVRDLESGRSLIKERKYSLAVAPLERAVAAGNADAMYELSELLGKPGVADDEARSMQLINDAVAQGQPDAIFLLAIIKLMPDEDNDQKDPVAGRALLERLHGRDDHWSALAQMILRRVDHVSGTKSISATDLTEAEVEVLTVSANAGNDFAATLLLLGSFEVPEETQDLKRGYHWAVRLADAGRDEGQYYMGLCLISGNCGQPVDVERGWALLQKAAAQGNGSANALVGRMLMGNRLQIPVDLVMAKRYLTVAAGDEYHDAMYDLAQIALSENDWPTARSWLEKSTMLGNGEARNLRAVALIEGRYGYAKDERGGIALLREAAASGNADAQSNLADYYWSGQLAAHGLAKDPNEARRLYRLAADQGNSWGLQRVGNMYLHGTDGISRDVKKAGELFRQAAETQDADAQAQYADYLTYHMKDPVQARGYYEKAVAQGDLGALVGLAYLYLDGLGVVPDRARGIELLQSAARQGNQQALKELQKLGLANQ